MINKDSDIEIIISRYLSKEATPEEIKVLDDWISATPENYRSFLSQKNVWEVSHPAFNPEEIDVDNAHRKVMEKILHQNQPVSVRPKLSFLHYWQQVAAILLLPLLILSAYLYFKPASQIAETYQELFTPYGTWSVVNLPDGSKVWLNANSELRYLSDFNADTRTVELTGQGYFEVTKNAHKPFIVKADKDYSVEVLGTSFNVSAYKDESMIETTLVEGSVKLNVVSGGKRMTQMLKPNEKAEYQKGAGKIKVFDVNTEYDTAWKNGEIIFRNHPMDKVLKTLERHYHVVFEVKDNEILKSIITARFKDEQLPQVLEYLKLASGIQYAIHKPTVKDSGSGTSVVEISK